jgi:hypothetical protein
MVCRSVPGLAEPALDLGGVQRPSLASRMPVTRFSTKRSVVCHKATRAAPPEV